MQHTFWMCCPCHFGLEHTLHFELKKLGAEQIQVQDGRILFRGDYHLLAMANLCLSTAEKLPEELSKFSEEERRLLESAPKYEVRFFLLELAEKIGIWFRSR